MSLLLDHTIDDHTRIAVWKVEEDKAFFLDALALSSEEAVIVEKMKAFRQQEWLSSRYLLHYISGDTQRRGIIKNMDGKPRRAACPKQISISHSGNYTAAVISDHGVGIDIQRPEEKISRIAHKFISEAEALRLDKKKLSDYHHIFWGAKEAMYKAYGLRKLEFREHMHLYPFHILDRELHLRGWVRKDDIAQDYKVVVMRLEDTYLVTAIQEN